MSDGKTILVDVSRCTGCRGCQVACKQWNELPATDTMQTGSYQNPPDMNGDTYKIVRFREGRHENGKPYWNFFTDMCRHCVNPPCVLAADEGTMIHDEATGAVVYTEKTAENDFDVLLDACPYRIPRKNEKTGAIVKCTMCIDRISAGGIPACVQSCPTGAMRFGERAAMLELAHKRVEELKKEFPKVHAVDPDDVRVIYVITDDPDKYAEHVGAGGNDSPRTPSDFYVALEVCSRSGMDELGGFFDGVALMGRFRMDAGQPCIKTWEHGRRGRGEGRS